MGTYKARRHIFDPELDLPSYATYRSNPTTGRMVLPRDYQIPYDYPLPWNTSSSVLSSLNLEEPKSNRLVTRNHNRNRCLDVDLDEDDGAYATLVPITYQLPPSDEVQKNFIKTREVKEMEAKSDELKDDIGRSIRMLQRGSTHCHLCTVFKESETAGKLATAASTEYHKLGNHYRPLNPGWNYENEMSRLMRRSQMKPNVTEIIHDEWQLINPIRRVAYEINRKAMKMDIDSKTVHSKDGPKWLTRTEFPVDEDEIPKNKFNRPVHFTKFVSTRYPSDQSLTRRSRTSKYIE